MIEITLLTQPDCALCDHAKQVLARLAADHPIAVTEMDATGEAARRLTERTVIPFAPGLFVNGRLFGYGRISERRLRRTLRELVQEGTRS